MSWQGNSEHWQKVDGQSLSQSTGQHIDVEQLKYTTPRFPEQVAFLSDMAPLAAQMAAQVVKVDLTRPHGRAIIAVSVTEPDGQSPSLRPDRTRAVGSRGYVTPFC